VKIFHLFCISVPEGARCSLHVATDPSLEGVSGRYFEKSREAPPARAALDEALQERLWALSEELVSA
jgi:retinol dehydrogenase-12